MYETTMTGSFFRTQEIGELLKKSSTGEIDNSYEKVIQSAESLAISDQLHPLGSKRGLTWVSNGEQRKSGYTTYIPNRFSGFSTKKRVSQQFSETFYRELMEANPSMGKAIQDSRVFELPAIEEKLVYRGEKQSKREAEDAKKLAKELGAKRIFIPSPSPGVITVFYPPGKAYHDHEDYLFDLSKELAREYRSILSVDGVDLQIDAPDLAMAKSLGVDWTEHFYGVLPKHVQAINEAIKGLPPDRIRVHYCYGNYSASHLTDPDYSRVLPEMLKLNVGTIVGEMANPRHAGDPLIIRKHVKEYGWPKNMKFAAGVIDVKSPFVETPEGVSQKLHNVSDIDEIGEERVIGGTDCGFETFSGMGGVPKSIALQKLKSLAEGAGL
jgi:5-methyltetrahydropteroyltriglutamate--homocysteine methyltransferase